MQLNLQRFLDNSQPLPPIRKEIDGEVVTDLTIYNGPESSEPVGPKIPHGPLRQLAFAKIRDKASLMDQLNTTIILNDLDLPQFIYRPDMLDPVTFASLEEVTQEGIDRSTEQLEAATVFLGYPEGYPTIDMKPFWLPLSWESHDAFTAFGMYLAQAGARQASAVDVYKDTEIQAWFHENCWVLRARAYDMFKIVHHRRLQVQRMLSIEENHFQIADKLVHQVSTKLSMPELWTDSTLDAKELTVILEKAVKIQRISAGLSANGGESAKEPPKNAEIEVVMRQIAPTRAERPQEVDNYDLLREDPDEIEAAQEMIIRVNSKR